MAVALDVDKEQMRMLVLAVGCTEAAKQTGVPLNTVLSWSSRGEWLKLKEQVLPATVQPRAINAINPGDALANTLLERKNQMRLAQSKYLIRASEKLADTDDELLLEHAQTGKALADMASKVWPEQHQDTGTHLSFFSISLGQPIADPEKPVAGHVIGEE